MGTLKAYGKKENNTIILKSSITLTLLAKKKIKNIRRLKDLGTCTVEVDLLASKFSDCAGDSGSDGDFSMV